jgi:hypothetical protein
MKHGSSRELFDHWGDLRGARAAPDRADIDPGAIRKALGDAFLLGLEPGENPAFRLAGTRVCALFGRELKGERFVELWHEQARPSVRELLTMVAEEVVGVIAGVSALTRDGLRVDLELLLLPLRHRVRGQGRMIGTLAPLDPPFWIGATSLRSLRLGIWRQLGPAVEPNRLARLVPGSRPHAFVIYQGGAPDSPTEPH